MDLPSAPREAPRVLIAGVDPDHIALARVFPAPFAVSIDVAANGAEALEWWSRRRYDLMILNLNMPVLDGWAVARAIRQKEREGRLKRVTTLFALITSEAGLPVDRGDFDGHLTNPPAPAELYAAIVKFARSQSDRASSAADSIIARRPLYLANRRRDGEKMKSALAAGDLNAIRIIGHNSKGTGAGYGFPEIGSAGAAIEAAARASDIDRLEAAIGHFEGLVEEALRQSSGT